MDPRSKHNSAMHQFLTSGRGAVAVEFAFVLPIILLIIWAFWQMSESYRLQWTLNRQTASLADMLINQPEQLNFGGGTESVTLPLEQQFPVLIASANEMLKKQDQVESLVNRSVENKLSAALKNVVKLNHKEISVEDFNKLFA